MQKLKYYNENLSVPFTKKYLLLALSARNVWVVVYSWTLKIYRNLNVRS